MLFKVILATFALLSGNAAVAPSTGSILRVHTNPTGLLHIGFAPNQRYGACCTHNLSKAPCTRWWSDSAIAKAYSPVQTLVDSPMVVAASVGHVYPCDGQGESVRRAALLRAWKALGIGLPSS